MLACDRPEHMRELVDERLAPADDVTMRPPEAHERVLRLGDEDAAEPVRVANLELVQALHVERERPLRPVDLEGVRVRVADRELRAFQLPSPPFLNFIRRTKWSSTAPSGTVVLT